MSYKTYNRDNTVRKVHTQPKPSFQGMYTYNPDKRFSLQKLNPVVLYMNKVFERSIQASRKRIQNPIPALAPHVKEITLKTGKKDKTYAWDINDGKRKKYAIILHGTSQNISNLQLLYKSIFEQTDFGIIAPEYRSFGKNKNSLLSYRTFREDSTAALDYLKEKNIKPENIYVIGHSFGGFVASQLVKNNQDIGRLMLVSSIDSLEHESVNIKGGLRNKVPPFIEYLFSHFKAFSAPFAQICQTNQCLKDIKTPVDIIHSKNDKLIKSKSSENLAALSPNLHSLNIVETGGHTMEAKKIQAIVKLLLENYK